MIICQSTQVLSNVRMVKMFRAILQRTGNLLFKPLATRESSIWKLLGIERYLAQLVRSL